MDAALSIAENYTKATDPMSTSLCDTPIQFTKSGSSRGQTGALSLPCLFYGHLQHLQFYSKVEVVGAALVTCLGPTRTIYGPNLTSIL